MRLRGALLLALVLLCGCTGTGDSLVRPLRLGREQQEIVDLLGTGQVILLYEFDTREAYTHFDAWVEIYQDGECIEPHAAGLSASEPVGREWKGRLAVTVTETPDFVWTFTHEDSGYGSSATTRSDAYPHHGETARSSGGMQQPAAVTDGGEIVLYAGVFTNRGELRIHSAEEYAQNPALIGEAEYLHLIKCRFSNLASP